MAVVTYQPMSSTFAKELYKSGQVSVRTLMDTQEDCDFVGRLLIEAFRGKMTHATRESSLPLLMEHHSKHCRGRQQEFYDRYLIAEYNGIKAGACCLRYHGDSKKFPYRGDDFPSGFGCCDICGLECLYCVLTSDEIPLGNCYVDHICVADGNRGKGIGKVLLDCAEIDSKKNNCGQIYLWVMTNNPAQRLYSRQGYTVTETTTGCGCCLRCASGEKEAAKMEKQLM